MNSETLSLNKQNISPNSPFELRMKNNNPEDEEESKVQSVNSSPQNVIEESEESIESTKKA